MSRLASLTPSRHTSSPRNTPSPTPSPSAAPITIAETTHHRKLRLLLTEFKTVFRQWDEYVGVDGLKAGKGCIDEATEMDNLLATPESPERPPIAPHLEALHTHRAAFSGVLNKLDKLLHRLSLLTDQAETLYFEAYSHLGPSFCMEDPLWSTWSMERFVDSLLPLLTLHSTHLQQLIETSCTIVSPKTPFEEARLALEHWRDLSRGGERWDGVREWEELVGLEMALPVKEEEEEVVGKGRRKGRKG